MFDRFKPQERPSIYDESINKVLVELSQYDPNDEEYGQLIKHLGELTRMKNETNTQFFGVSPDTLAVITANLIGIVLIIRHEHLNVVTSKAMSLIVKPKT